MPDIPEEKRQRPRLGEWCEVLSECRGRTQWTPRRKEWKADIDQIPGYRPEPVRMMHIGRRFVHDGEVSFGYEGEIEFKSTATHEVCLFVKNERDNPVRAFPRHVRQNRLDNLLEEIHGVE